MENIYEPHIMRTKRKHTKWSIVSSREGKGHVPNVSKAIAPSMEDKKLGLQGPREGGLVRGMVVPRGGIWPHRAGLMECGAEVG